MTGSSLPRTTLPHPPTPIRWLMGLLLVLGLLGVEPARAEGVVISRRAGLPSDGVTALAWGEDTLWVGTVQGLGRWAEGRVQTIPFPLNDEHILALHHDGIALWAGTANGIARREGETWQSWQRGDAGLGNEWATSFTVHQGALVVGTYGGGVYRWEGGAWQGLAGSPAQVSTLASDGARLWVGTPRGLWRGEGIAWQAEPLPAPDAAVRALLVTEEALWVGSEAGLFRRALAESAAWQPTLREGVTALAERRDGVVAATPRGLLDGTSTAGLPGPLVALSVLLPTPAGLAVGTLGQGVWVEGRIPVDIPPALPVVLLHGMGDSNELSDSQLRFLRHWLERDGHVVALAPYDEAAPLLDNVTSVRHTVAALRKETGQARVLLIAHSLGGLVARGYLASGATEVAGLVTLGTPHAGVRLVYDFLVTDLPTDSTPNLRELLPEHAALTAPFAEQGAVPQLHIGGNLLPQGNLFEGFPPHDGIITAASATAAPGATRLSPLLHGWTLATMQQGLPSLLWPEELYLNTMRPWLQSLESSPQRDRAEPLPLPPAGFTQRPLVARALASGEQVTVPVALDGQPATWLLEEGSGVTLDLLAPDGTRYPGDRFLLGERVAHLPYRESIFQPLDLWSTRSLPGLWQAQLTNEGSSPVSVRLVLVEPRRPALSLSLVEPWVAPGGTVTVDGQGPPGLGLTVTLGEAQAAFVEGSPGIYRASLPAPTRPGYHALRVADAEIERWAVVGVRSEAWTVEEATLTRASDESALRLALVGEGRVALGLRLLRGEELLATRLVGSFRFPTGGSHTLTHPLPDLSLDGVRVEWQLFDAWGALVPITGIERVGE